MIGLLAVCLIGMVMMMLVFTRAIRGMRTIKMDPQRIDETPVFQCQECGSTWLEDMPPIHEIGCPVAYAKGETQRFTG